MRKQHRCGSCRMGEGKEGHDRCWALQVRMWSLQPRMFTENTMQRDFKQFSALQYNSHTLIFPHFRFKPDGSMPLSQ